MPPRGEEADSTMMDWTWIKSLNPKQLEEEDLERLVPLISGWKPDENEEPSKVICMFNLASSALQSRDEDLNEAMEALGDKEADKETKEENKRLKRELKEVKKENKEMDKQLKRFQKAKSEGGGDEALDDLLAVEQALEQSQKENREMEKDLERERRLKDELEKKVDLLGMEKKQLKRDVEGLRDELENARNKTSEDGNSTGGTVDELEEKRVRELEENIRMKNKQIHSLIEDIEQTEKESVEYQNKVIELRDQMAETTKQMNAMTGEYVAMKEAAQHYSTIITNLQEENDRVKGLLEELMEDKANREKQIDQVEAEMEKRVEQMKQILEYKEASIEELRARLNRAHLEGNIGDQTSQQQGQENVAMLTQALRDRDEQIEQMQEKLAEASREIESSAALIESFSNAANKKGGDPIQKSLLSVKGQLQKVEQRTRDLEQALLEAEEAAKEKSEELSAAIAQIRAYEKGEYGLEQAVDQLRQSKRSEKVKDQKIEELTGVANHFQYHFGEVLEEVNQLREKMGLSPYSMEQFTSDSVAPSAKTSTDMVSGNMKKLQTQKQKDRALLQVMGREIERLEEERIHLKTENRKMARQLGHKAAELGLNAEDLQAIDEYKHALKSRRNGNADNVDVIQRHESIIAQQMELEEKEAEIEKLQQEMVEYKTRYEDLLEENGELRKGMQQILEDVKTQDGKSDVLIHCPALEKLVGILDARHLWGNYHPAMSLKAQIDKLEGANTELRDQIRKSRLEEDRLTNQLQRAKSKMTGMEAELRELRDAQMLQQPSSGAQGKDLKVAIPSLIPPSFQTSPPSPSPHGMSATGSEMLSKLNMQLIQVLNQLETKEEQCKMLKEELECQHSKLSVLRHQLGLIYEQFYEERKDKERAFEDQREENRHLNESIEAMKAKIQEYESHLEALQNGEMESKFADTTRKMVILKSNEALLIRRYQAVEDSENQLRKENNHLKEDFVRIENKFMEKLGALQRHKEMSSFKIDYLQQALSESVPVSSLEEANSHFNDLTAKYRLLLEQEQAHSTNDRKIEELELVIDNLNNEKARLTEELQAAKEKLISCEVIVTRLHSAASAGASVAGDESPAVNMVHDHQLESLSKQIATLEMKELNEKQRADHSENKSKLLQAQIMQLEKRNEELEVKFADIAKANLELQKHERALRDQLLTSVAKEKFDNLAEKVQLLDKQRHEIKIENDKLKEVSEVARNQIELFENRKNAENLELEALRHAVIDLQSQTEEKSLIGKLHRQIVGFQMKENESASKIKQLEKKLSHAEAHSHRLQQKADEKELWAVQIRTQAYIKAKSLFRIIQDLRRQYSGSVPLSRQEKLSEILRELKEDKRRASMKLKQAEDKLKEAQARADELIVKQESVDQFMSALKQGAGTKQVTEWQKKLEELRLRELRSRRLSERWSAEVDHLRELTTAQARKIDQLEEELVRMENQIEQKQLDWETRAVELEAIEEQPLDKKMTTDGNFKVLEDALLIPNPSWPLAKQLEQSLNMVKAQSKSLDENKKKLADARKLLEEFKKKLREAESMILAKDRIINDLRMQVPSTVDRALAIASITGDHGLPVSLTTDYESKQSLNIAQATVASLRERLEQKEETLARYEKILKQARMEFEAELRRKQEEIVDLKKNIQDLRKTVQDMKVSSLPVTDWASPSKVIVEKMQRIEELEDDILELQTSLTELSRQLAEEKSNAESFKMSANAKQKEIDHLKDTYNLDSQVQQSQTKQEVDKYSSEVKMLKSENALLQNELRVAKEAIEKTPTSVMSSLVEKLRNDNAEKEKKIRAMGRIIADLKNELVNSADAKDRLEHEHDFSREGNADIEAMEETRKKMDDLNFQNEKLSRQVEMLKTKQISSFAEIKSLKEELSKKGSLLVKLKEDKMKRPSNVSPSKSSSDREKDELRKTIRQLEARLNSINKAEKPLEENREREVEIPEPAISDKQIKTAAELARWDESKKWLHKVDSLKSKLSDADAEVSKLSKTNNGLREMVSRLEREKLIMENRAKMSGKSVKANIADIKNKELQVENAKLREELEATRHSLLMQGTQGTETLKMRNKFLQERIEAQERKITTLELAKKAGGDSSKVLKKLEEIQEKEKECQKLNLKLQEENINLKVMLEQHRHDDPIISRAIQEINRVHDELRDSHSDALALELKSIVQHLSSGTAPSSEPVMKSPKKITSSKLLTDEIQKLKTMNEDLIAKLEAKNVEMEQLKASPSSYKALVRHEPTGLPYAVPNVEEIRKMEVDLKRKSDLLAEVKILLKQAADRERTILSSKEDLSAKLKMVLEIDPKSPSEALAKELRQARLTIERLQCEKKELEHQIQELEK